MNPAPFLVFFRFSTNTDILYNEFHRESSGGNCKRIDVHRGLGYYQRMEDGRFHLTLGR